MAAQCQGVGGAAGDQLGTELTSHSERQKVGSMQPLNLSPDQAGSERPLVAALLTSAQVQGRPEADQGCPPPTPDTEYPPGPSTSST